MKMKKIIAFILTAGMIVSASPLTVSAETTIDYELVGLWFVPDNMMYSLFTTDGMLYNKPMMTGLSAVENFYNAVEAGETNSLVYSTNNSILTSDGRDYEYTIEGNTMQLVEVESNSSRTYFRVFNSADVDNDSEINSVDASAVLTEYTETATGGEAKLDFVQTKAADVNCDGAVDSSDASSILAYYAYTATGGKACFAEYYYGG